MFSQFSFSRNIVTFIKYIFLSTLFTFAVYSQSLSETWNPPIYQPSEYSEFYGGVYFSNSLEEWDYKVEEVLFQSISQWKETAEIMVEQMLALEDGSDAFIANEGYLDERRKSLFSEVTVLYSAWERELMDDYFDNRNSFLHKLETGKVDSLYFQRIGQVSMYEEFTKEELKINENRNRILESAKEWEFQWNQTRQEGLDSFSNSFTELESDYQAYIQSLAETEIRFSDNLTAINSYKETIKTALREMVSQLQLGLDSECSVNTGCQYKNFDGSFNEAGKLFSKFIGDLALELNGPNIDPDSIFTLISTKIRDFLSNESNKAFSEYLRYHDQIYTYQTGFQINLDQTKTKFDLGGAQWNLRNQSFWQLSSDKRYENWLAGGSGEIGNFGRVYDSELRAIFQSIHNSNYQSLASIINGRLGEGRSVQSILSANLYTDVYNYINNEKLGDFYIPFDRAYHTSGNLLLDGKDKYGLWLAERYLSVGTPKRLDLQMGAIGYSVLYEMYDDNSYQTSLYWNGNYSQLGGQRDHFQNTLLPAVSHWETKVKEYSDFYENWKENRENLIADAKTKLDTNRMELERSKEDWLSRLEEEKRNGLNSWTELYKNGELAESPSPAISSWSPSSKWVPFQDAKLLEFKNSSIFDGSTENITIGNSNLLQDLQRSIVGVGQYASVLQMNNDLEELKLSEQKKLINQMAYEIRWDSLGGRELSKEEKILLGSYDVTQLSKEEQSRFGSCYENPEQSLCQSLLKREYETVIDTRNGVLTLKKEIHNGLLAGKNADGQYNAGKMEEVRHVQLSSIGKIQLTKTNDFFNIWNEEDWESLYQKKSEITESFLTHSLQNDKKFINSNLISIQEKDNRNQALYLERKESQESADSIFQELAVAYFTGGAAGVKASLKGKLESTINSEMAKAWVKATGGSESDIQTASMMVDFMRGRMSAKKIQSRDQYISIKNPIQAYESITAKALSAGQKILDYGAFGMSNVAVNLMQAPALALYKTLAGEKQYNKTNNQIAGTGKRLEEIKENEQMLVQNGISVAVSQATGLPIEEVSKMLGDKMNQIKAEKANKAMAKNPIFDFSSVLLGSTGGIIKTAVVAFGMPEDEIQSILKDANRISNAGNLSQNSSEDAYLGYTFQALGMKADWTQHKSNYLDLNDSKAVVEDLGKKAISKELAKSWGMDESAINQIVDSTYSTYQKQKADKKARAKAVRQTAVNAVSIAITLGASGALAGVNSVLSNIGKVASSITNGILPATAQVGQAVASTFVQTIAGSHEGPKGAIAGFANGVLGGVTQGMGKIQSGFFKGMVPGLGVSYSEKNGWGGSLGIGNNLNNISVSFSEKGDTTLQASKSLAGGVQIAADITTNGASNVGFNYNPTGKGPRKDANFSLMYDLNGGGLSGSIGYTDPNSKLGLTTSIDKDGVSASSELQGVTLGRNTKNGFEMQEMNFAEQNINAAQDESEIGAGDKSPADKDAPEQEGDFLRDSSDAGLALAGLLAGGAAAAAKLFSGAPLPNSSQGAASAGESLVLERDRRREEEGDDAGDEDSNEENDIITQFNQELSEVNQIIRNLNDDLSDYSLADGSAEKSKNDIMAEGDFSGLTPAQDFSRKSYLVSTLSEMFKGGKVNAQYFADNFGILSKSLDPATLTKFQTLVENSYQRVKDDSGRLVFSHDQVSIFNQQTSVVINGKLFVREPGTDYFISDAKFPDGKDHKIKFTQEGKVKEVTTDLRTGQTKSTIWDTKGQEIRKDLGKSNQEEFNSFQDKDDQWSKVKEVYVLGNFDTAEKMINFSTLSADDKKKMIAELKSYKKEWNDMGSTKQEALHQSYLLKKYDLPVLQTISTNGKAGDEPVANGGFYKTTVNIVDGSRIAPYPDQAESMKDFRYKLHYEPSEKNGFVADSNAGKYKVDLNSDYNAGNDMMWYGPNTQFKVLDVKIEGGSGDGFNNAGAAHGTNIRLALLDKNGNTTSVVDVVHLTAINNQLIEALQSTDPNKKILPAGTFLGATPKKIGDTSGPHLHMHSYGPNGNDQMERKDFYDHWVGDKK